MPPKSRSWQWNMQCVTSQPLICFDRPKSDTGDCLTTGATRQAKLALERRRQLREAAVGYLRNPDAPPPEPKQARRVRAQSRLNLSCLL